MSWVNEVHGVRAGDEGTSGARVEDEVRLGRTRAIYKRNRRRIIRL